MDETLPENRQKPLAESSSLYDKNDTDALQAKLSNDPRLANQGVSCSLRDGTLTLFGRVSSYYLKQIAQNCVRGAESVNRIENQIEVISADDSSSLRKQKRTNRSVARQLR